MITIYYLRHDFEVGLHRQKPGQTVCECGMVVCENNSIEAFCEELHQDLIIIGKEVPPSTTVADRIDILAVDKSGTTVVIELKRGSDKLQLLQAIGYAAMISKWTPDELLSRAAN